ncbi:MAG: hypothetical protein IT429_17010 [Gemmataceae bacterium]|nr:hypothetical protein [Gemmataceae bacterium]
MAKQKTQHQASQELETLQVDPPRAEGVPAAKHFQVSIPGTSNPKLTIEASSREEAWEKYRRSQGIIAVKVPTEIVEVGA